MNRRSSGGASAGGNRPRRIPQFPQKRPPTPPPTTPFQPGAPPAPPLSPIGAGLAGLVLLGQALWNALNQRPPEEGSDPSWEASDGVPVTYPEDSWIWLQWTLTITSSTTDCNTGESSSNTTTGGGALWGYGRGFRVVGPLSRTVSKGCDGVAGVSLPEARFEVLNGSGDVIQSTPMASGGASIGEGTSGSVTISVSPNPQFWPGYTPIAPPAGGKTPGEFAPGMEPAVPEIQDAAVPVAAPGPGTVAPLQVPEVPTGSERVTSTVVTVRPGGSTGSSSSSSGAPALVPTAPGRVPQAPPQTTPLTPTGPAPLAPPVKAPVTPLEGVVIGGELIGGPGSPPPPTMAGMAAELGRLEKKGELMLERSGPLAQIPDVIDAIADLVELLDSFDPGGSYSIRPACGTDANGDPLPPIEVPIQPGLGLAHAVTARLDAIAELIDHHKQLRQPICKGKPAGEPVTVTFVESE